MTDDAAAIVYEEIQKTDVLTGAKYMPFAQGVEEGLIRFVGDDCKRALYDAIEDRQVRPGLCKTAGLKLVYSPLNGSGLVPVTQVLKDIGITDITIVPEQEYPNGYFTTCSYPNPEIFEALEKGLNSQFDRAANKVYSSYQIEQNTAESDRLDALRSRHETGKSEAEIEAEFEQKKKELQDGLQEQLSDAVKSFIETSTQSVVETTEKKIKEREKAGIEDSVRDHLRGFSRTIPSFLMAYGDDTVTLATFDAVIPNPVFLEVTSITLDQFRFLRDGGKYTDAETGEERDFAGNLFDPVVFDDSVKEFLRLKKKLADYFDEKSIEDIFDYIPPQKTNQIFTPKTMVKKMVDMLEAENPGCFDDPDKTFIDLYMKSGLYITEIVKRLYQSEQMKKQFPDPKERLRHIFEK